MKKIVKQSVFFFLPILLFIILAEILLEHIPNDYAYKKKYLDTQSNNIEILYLGNSHIYYGINPQYNTLNSFNASHISQSLNLDYAILKKYQNRWTHLKYIVVPVDYFSLYTTLENGPEKWRIKNYAIYYDINQYTDYLNRFEIANGKLGPHVKRLISYYINDSSEIYCNTFGWGYTYASANNKDLAETGWQAAKRHTVNKDSSCLQKNINILDSIIALADNIHSQVIFVTSPAYKTYINNLNPKQLNHTIDIITKLSIRHTNTSYYNLLTDQSFTKEDFYDADHLNELGAKKMTLKIDRIISQTPDTKNKQ